MNDCAPSVGNFWAFLRSPPLASALVRSGSKRVIAEQETDQMFLEHKLAENAKVEVKVAHQL